MSLSDRTEKQALMAVVRHSLRWANFCAGEGIMAIPEMNLVAPEDSLMAYTEATGDENWGTAPDRIADRIEELLEKV